MGMAVPDVTPEHPAPLPYPEREFFTADMVRDLMEEARAWPRYETLYGELVVTPAPRPLHNWLADELRTELHLWLRRFPAGIAFGAPSDVSWGRPDVLVQPDVFVVPYEQARRAMAGEGWRAITHLLLAVEVVSPSSAKRDRFGKRVLYQRQGVERYWALDPELREAEGWTADAVAPERSRDRLTWHPAGAPEPFVFDFAERLASVLDR